MGPLIRVGAGGSRGGVPFPYILMTFFCKRKKGRQRVHTRRNAPRLSSGSEPATGSVSVKTYLKGDVNYKGGSHWKNIFKSYHHRRGRKGVARETLLRVFILRDP